ncbi:hypothetical protein ACR3FU_002065 [Yersinia enterocolitica]
MSEVVQKGGFKSNNTQIVIKDSIVDMIRSPSIFMQLVSILAKSPKNEGDTLDEYESYDIEIKISHNEIIKYRDQIGYYYVYVSMIENAYSTLNESGVSARETALDNINSCYKKCVGDLLLKNKEMLLKCNSEVDRRLLKLDLIKSNSDYIIGCVIEHVQAKCMKSISSINCSIEDIENHSEFIVFHAFIECKVLEKP